MKSSRICCLALLLLLAIHGNVRAAMQLIYPAEKSWVRRSDYLILKTNNEAITGVRITVNGIDSDILDIGSKDYQRVFQDILIVQPVWDKGKNTLLIEGFKGSEKLETIGTEVYFEPAGDRALVPKEYHDNQLHTPDVDKICTPCHAAGGGGERLLPAVSAIALALSATRTWSRLNTCTSRFVPLPAPIATSEKELPGLRWSNRTPRSALNAIATRRMTSRNLPFPTDL